MGSVIDTDRYVEMQFVVRATTRGNSLHTEDKRTASHSYIN